MERDVPPGANTAWVAVMATVAALLIAGAIVVLGGKQGPQPPFLESPGTVARPTPPARDEGVLVMAGSGSNLPITRELLQSFDPGESGIPVLHPSIGSGGGIRALLDGVVDLALVSRPLKESERALGLISVPYAQVPVVVAVHADVPDTDISRDRLVAVYAGHERTWSDGSRITVLQRERGDSSHIVVDTLVSGFEATNEEAYREGRWRVLYHDDAMNDALDSTPGSIGLFGQGSVPRARSIRALSVDGVEPTLDNIADGSYPFSKILSFVTVGEPSGEVARFIAHVRSPAGAAVIRSAGGLPIVGPKHDASVPPTEDP